MDINSTVMEIMTRDVIVAEKTNKFSEVQKLFSQYHLNHLPVVENDVIVGIISTTDIMRCYSILSQGGIHYDEYMIDEKFRVEDIMTKKPIHVDPDTTIGRAIRIFKENNIQSLPVVRHGRVEGIITIKDIAFAVWNAD